MAETNYTQEQLDEAIQNAKTEWVNNELDPVVAERDNLLQYKPKDLTEEEKAFQQKQQDLFDKEIGLELKSVGLDQFKDIIKVNDFDELQSTIKALTKIMNDVKISTGYIPKDHAQMTEYDQAKQNGDSKSMIKSLFGLK